MKFNCDALTEWCISRRAARTDRDLQWRKFFAVLPRKVAPGDCRCLETIERRLVLHQSLENHLLDGFFTRTLVPLTSWEYRSVRR